MAKKNKRILLSSKELKVKIKSLKDEFESISSMTSPNRDLIRSIREKISHLTDQLKMTERMEQQKKERQVAHQNSKRDTINRKNEQEEKKEITSDSNHKVSFGSTLTLSEPS